MSIIIIIIIIIIHCKWIYIVKFKNRRTSKIVQFCLY
jgi:hypothetical protein